MADPAEGHRLHARGFGTPRSGGGLDLHPVEAAYLIEQGRLDGDLVRTLSGQEIAFLAYRDLRGRGLLVRPNGEAFDAWRRGEAPPQAPWFTMRPYGERERVRVGDLVTGVCSVVDDDGQTTHYLLEEADPQGAGTKAEPEHPAQVLSDRVLVADTFLSFTEAERRRRAGQLDVPPLGEQAAATQHHFTRTWPIVADLDRRGVTTRSGFRFGTHLRAYDGDPDATHAPWLVQCHFPDDTPHWSELSRAVRLAHGVRKTFLLAIAEPVQYFAMTWFRP